VFSEDEMHTDTLRLTHTFTKCQSIASVNCSRLFPPAFFGEGSGLCSPAHPEVNSDVAENTFRLRGIVNFFVNLLH